MRERIGVVAAMAEELRAIRALWPGQPLDATGGRSTSRALVGSRELLITLAGVGKVAAATTATILIERYRVQAIIFTGTAGGLAPAAAIGDLVVADAFLQHDMDASPLFPRWEVPLYGRSRFPTDRVLSERLVCAASTALANPNPALSAALQTFGLSTPSLHRGLVVSGDRFVATAAGSAQLRSALPDALAVEMEGAAVAQVCSDYGVPFAALRTVSDRADGNAHLDFTRFVADVASRLSAAVLERWLRG